MKQVLHGTKTLLLNEFMNYREGLHSPALRQDVNYCRKTVMSSSEEEEAGPEPPVGVSLCDSAPLLWSVQELRAARASGLVGALVGCLPRAPRQNGRLGRPLLLLPEELRVLRDSERTTEEELRVLRDSEGTTEELRVLRDSEGTTEELRVLRDSEGTTEELRVLRDSEGTTEELRVLRDDERTTEEELRVLRDSEGTTEEEQGAGLRFEEFLSQSLEEQSKLALDNRKSALTSSLSGTEAEALRGRLEALDHSFVFPRSALAVQLSTCREGLAHLQPIRSQLRSSEPIRSQLRGSEPIRSQLRGSEPMGRQLSDPQSEVRLQVFRDLRRRGFYLTSGGKFGADFLVYPGDPLRFHAHFMAVCVSLEDGVSVWDVLCWVRLASNVKKTLLLCSSSPPGGVQYSSLQWSGLS